MKFEVGKLYMSRRPRLMRILATDCPGAYPIVAVTLNCVGDSDYVEAITYTADGRAYIGSPSEDDLLPPEREWTLETDDGERIRVREVVGEQG